MLSPPPTVLGECLTHVRRCRHLPELGHVDMFCPWDEQAPVRAHALTGASPVHRQGRRRGGLC